MKRRRWDEAAIAEAIVEWAAEHRLPPTKRQWTTGGPKHPDAHTVRKVYGSWNKAIEAAGFQTVAPGHNRWTFASSPNSDMTSDGVR